MPQQSQNQTAEKKNVYCVYEICQVAGTKIYQVVQYHISDRTLDYEKKNYWRNEIISLHSKPKNNGTSVYKWEEVQEKGD